MDKLYKYISYGLAIFILVASNYVSWRAGYLYGAKAFAYGCSVDIEDCMHLIRSLRNP